MSRENDQTATAASLASALGAYARGDLPAALRSSMAVLLHRPSDPHVWQVLAYAAAPADPASALTAFRRVVAVDPNSPDAWSDVASSAAALARTGEPARALRRAVALDPSAPPRWRDLGIALGSAGKSGAIFLRRSLSMEPDDALAWRTLAEVSFRDDDGDATAIFSRRALALLPSDVGALMACGLLALKRRELPVASAAFGRAATTMPQAAQAWHNLALALGSAGIHIAGDRAMRRALVAHPAFNHTLLLAGNRCIETGDTTHAGGWFRRAQSADPEFAEAATNLGMLALLDGNYSSGWAGFNHRWRCASHAGFRPTPDADVWHGHLDRKGRLLLRSEPEQALGDTIQFARFVPSASERVGELIIECASTLHALVRRIPGVARTIAIGDDPGPVDWSCGLMDLGAIFAETLGSVPASVPYLAADASTIAAWQATLADLPRPRIGLCWRGNPRFRMDRWRSPGLGPLTPLLRRGAGHLISLVLDRRADEVLPDEMADPMALIVDMADTAALVASLDLVITSDTAVAHLAGALALPAWVLLHDPADWRWLRDRADSPWYPSLRLFRQPRPGDWAAVVEDVVEALDASL